MHILHKREEFFEQDYAHCEELGFNQRMRRTRIFALELADYMGMDGGEAEGYACKLIDVLIDKHDDDAVLDQALCDLHDIGISEQRLYLARKMLEAEERAIIDEFGLEY